MSRNFEHIEVEGGKPIKAWIKGVELEDAARRQLENVARLPFVHSHVAVMPDVHYGKGATIGSVIPTRDAIIPAAVGVDIGCGMQAVRLDLHRRDLNSLDYLSGAIKRAIPHGRTDNGGANDKGAWVFEGGLPGPKWHREVFEAWFFDQMIDGESRTSLDVRWTRLKELIPELKDVKNTARHLGTLGTGNHFLEIQEDEEGCVWLMLHSGSRGPGAKIADVFIRRAKAHMKKWHVALEDDDLAFLPKSEPDFDLYIEALRWAQDFAKINRRLMMDKMIEIVGAPVAWRFDNHHNFAALENHSGQNLWITRKGATRARAGEPGIIPGSMGGFSYIVEGKGAPGSFQSCSHGAGRRMSRTQAMKTISMEQHLADTEHVHCRKDAEVIDESPRAYKDVEAVIAAQSDLIEVKHRLRGILNVKG
mgnify:CR=1 FL=1